MTKTSCLSDAIMAIIARIEALIIVVTLGLHDIIQQLFFRPFPPRGRDYVSVDPPAVTGKVSGVTTLLEWSRNDSPAVLTVTHDGMATVRAESPEDAIETLLHTLDK